MFRSDNWILAMCEYLISLNIFQKPCFNLVSIIYKITGANSTGWDLLPSSLLRLLKNYQNKFFIDIISLHK